MDVGFDRRGDMLHATLNGRMDGETSSPFYERVEAELKETDRGPVLGIADLRFISSAGPRTILVTARDLQRRGTELALCAMPATIREACEISGFDKTLKILDSKVAAEALFRVKWRPGRRIGVGSRYGVAMTTKKPINLLLSAVLGLALATPVQAVAAKEPAGGVLLTVAGDVAKVNRPGYDPRRDVFFKYHERSFDRAVEFDRAALEGLGVVTARVEFAKWDGPKTLSGPRLVDVLTAAGCGNGAITTLALDGFATEMSADTVLAHNWILSTRANGRPHDIGGRGPLWLVFDPPGDRSATAEEEGMWPWQLFFIRCGSAP